MRDDALRDLGERLKAHLAKEIDAAIEEAIKLTALDGGGFQSIMCQHADAVSEDFRFFLLDIVADSHEMHRPIADCTCDRSHGIGAQMSAGNHFYNCPAISAV